MKLAHYICIGLLSACSVITFAQQDDMDLNEFSQDEGQFVDTGGNLKFIPSSKNQHKHRERATTKSDSTSTPMMAPRPKRMAPELPSQLPPGANTLQAPPPGVNSPPPPGTSSSPLPEMMPNNAMRDEVPLNNQNNQTGQTQ